MSDQSENSATRKPATDRETAKRLIGYLRPHTGTIVLGLLCAAGVAGITTLLSWAAKLTIDAMTQDIRRLNIICALVVVIFVIKSLLTYGQMYLFSLVAQRVTARLRDEIFAHLHSLSLSFFNKRRTGAIMSTLTADVPVIQQATLMVRDIVAAPLGIIGAFAVLSYTSWRLTLAAVFVVPLMGAVIRAIGKRIRRISTMVQIKLGDIATIAEETISGVRIIKSFSAEREEVERFARENHQAFQTVMKGERRRAQLRPIVEFIGAFGIALVIFLGGHEIALNTRLAAAGAPPISNLRTVGDLSMFVLLLQQIARCVGEIGGINTTYQHALAAADRIFREVLDQRSELKEKPDAPEMPPIQGRVRFQNVRFEYEAGQPVLEDISFEAEPGEIVALVGHSGAGKSTLVDLIPRFYDVTSGTITIDGMDIRDVKIESLRRQIGIVPQESWLFAGTLRENIAYGKRNATEEEIRSAAYAANAYFIDGMPDKFDTLVGERGIRLSGGERQRIAIARAILMNPRILILDEATSSLDASSEALVQEALEQLMHGRTTFIIAHRLSTVLGADRILVLEQGRIVESGSHQELLSAGGAYATLYQHQFRGELGG